MQPRPRSYTVPITVLSVVLFLLVAGIVVVLSTRAGQNARTSRCEIGDWQVVTYREDVYVDAVRERITFTGGRGLVLRMDADGTGESDYGTGTTFEGASPDGRTVRLELSGPVRFRYTLEGDEVTVTPAGADATSQIFIDGAAYGARQQIDNANATERFTITCTDDKLIQDGRTIEVEYRRL